MLFSLNTHTTLSSACFFHSTYNHVVCFFHWTHNIAGCCFIHWTQLLTSVSFIEHNTVVCFSPSNSYNSAVWFLFRWTVTWVERPRRLTGCRAVQTTGEAEGRARGLWRRWRRSTPRWRHASEVARRPVKGIVMATQFGPSVPSALIVEHTAMPSAFPFFFFF